MSSKQFWRITVLNGDSSMCPQVSSNTKTLVLSNGYKLLSAGHELWIDFPVAEMDLYSLSHSSPLFTIGPWYYELVVMQWVAMRQKEACLHRNLNHVPAYPSPLVWLKPFAMWSSGLWLPLVFSLSNLWFEWSLKIEPDDYITLTPLDTSDILLQWFLNFLQIFLADWWKLWPSS